MAKKKRTGLDALQEYEAGSGYAASSATSYGQTQTQGKSTSFKRSGLDALREYEQYRNPGSVQDTTFDPNYRSRNYQTPGQNAAFEAYRNAVNAAQKTRNGTPVSGKVSEQEYSRSSGMQKQYGTYQNYLRGVEAAQGLKLGTLALQGQSALLAGRFAPATQQVREDVDAQNRRARAAQTAQRDQVRGMRRTSQELGKQIEALEIEQADTHFSGTGLSEHGKSVTQLQNEIENLQAQKTAVDNQSALARAQEAINGLSEEEQNLLRQYRGQELNGYQVRAYAKYDAKTALNEKGYSDDTIKRLAEFQKVLDDYENAQKLDQAAQEIGSGSFAGKAAATLFSAALAPGKALGNLESLRGVLPKWAGGYQNEDMPTNIYSPAYNASRLSSGIRQSVMQNMNPTGQFLYQAGTSALDSAVNMAVSTGLVGTVGGAAGAGAKDAIAETMNWVMGSQVAADSVYEGIQNGKSNADALVDGIVEGAIEGFTEKYSVGDIIENMLSGKAVWKKALRSFASEGAEEIASNWLNRAYDVVEKHDRGEVMSAYAAYLADGKTPAQALAAMVGDFAKEDSLSFLAGGLSGLAMSGTYAGVNRVILEANVTQTARAVIEAGEVQDVIDYGMAQEAGTKAHQLAEELQQTVDDGGEVTQKAVENTLREVAKEQQAAVDEGQEPRVPETLTRLEQLQAQAQQEQAQAEADEKTFQIYKSAAETAQENQRLAQQYQQEQEQSRAQQSVQAVQQAQQAAQRQYDQDSLFAPIPGTENMGELDPVQYAQRQTADAEQALDEAALQQEEQYLQTQAQRAGYDEQTAAYFLNGNTTGMPAEQYAQSFGQVYEQGRLGASEQRAMRYAEGMNQDVAAAAYRAGLAAGQKGVNNGSIEVTDEGQIGQAGQRAEGQTGGVRQSTAQRQRADAGRKRAQGARDLAKAWDEVTLSELGFGEGNAQTVRVMPQGQEAGSQDIKDAAKFFRSMGVQNARFFTGQLTQEIDGQTFYADAAVTEDGSVLIRADSEEYSAFELAKHEGYHLLVKRWPEMAAKIQKRLLAEGKITKAMIESYVDAYAGIYGDDTDAYVEEIVADTYAGMNRTDYGTNKLRADVKVEVGQWQKKSGSARAPPAGDKFSIIRVEGQKQDYGQGVLLDTNIFDGVKTRDWGSVLGKYVYENMAGAELTMYDENGDAETVYLARENDRVRKDGANRSHKVLDKLAGYRGDNVRAQAIVQLSEVLATSKQQETTDTHSHQWMDENGWIIRTAYLQNKNGDIYEATLNIADGRDRKILYEVNKVHQVDKTKIPGEHTATGESQHFRYQKTGAGGTQTEDGRTDAPRTFTAGVDGKNAADAGSSKNSISKTGETVKGKMSAQEGRYRDLMGEKAAQYTRRAENFLLAKIAGSFGVSPEAKRETLQPFTEQIVRKFLQTGELDNKLVGDLVDAAVEVSMEENQSYYEEYKGILKFIENQKISIPAQDKEDIRYWNQFRQQAAKSMQIRDDGMPVRDVYWTLHKKAPQLFPASNKTAGAQIMQIYKVAEGIRQTREWIEGYKGVDAAEVSKVKQNVFEARATNARLDWAKNDARNAVKEFAADLRVTQRYLDRQKKAKDLLGLAIPQSAEEALELSKEVKKLRGRVQYVMNKNLLTAEDQKIVGALLRGDISEEAVRKMKNSKGILDVYEAKAAYDARMLTLRAWRMQNKQRMLDEVDADLDAAKFDQWADKGSGWGYNTETPERNFADVMRKIPGGDVLAKEFNNKYIYKIKQNESARKNFILEIQERVKKLDISEKVMRGNADSEAYAVQLLGEAQENAEMLKGQDAEAKKDGKTYEEWLAVIQKLKADNPNMDFAKIDKAITEFHKIYDELLDMINQVRVQFGYDPVSYRRGYFPHFTENEESILARFGRELGFTGTVSPLPTTINGLTSRFRPGIRYFKNANERLGYATAYNAIKGLDLYLDTASDVIFHTEDVQRMRALETQIRYRASDEGIRRQMDAIKANDALDPDQKQQLIDELSKNGRTRMSHMAAWLTEYTNVLAGKRTGADRWLEEHIPQKIYNFVRKSQQRVGANMVAANIGSAVTNFIPLTQAWAQTSTVNMMKGMWYTLANYVQADGLDQQSVFINNRSGYHGLSQSSMDKASEIAGWVMEHIDGFTTGSIVRARMIENMQRGMSQQSALEEADQFASGIMADRSKGATPLMYTVRSPIVKMFTQFQLEVNNELSWIFKDLIPQERKKGVAALAKAMLKFLIGAWLYNEVAEAILGRRPALDPIDMLNDTVGDVSGYKVPNTWQAMAEYGVNPKNWDYTTEKKTPEEVWKGFASRVVDELPNTQLLAMFGLDEWMGLDLQGNRIAVISAFPDMEKVNKALLSSKEDMATKKKAQVLVDELSKPLSYAALPMGGGQVRKSLQGIMSVVNGGKYKLNNEGEQQLQYPTYTDRPGDVPLKLAQGVLFGRTATQEAQDWIENGFKSLSVKETKAYQAITEGGEDQRKTYTFVQAIKNVEKEYDKKMLLKSYSISDTAKTAYFYQVFANEDQQKEMDKLDEQGKIDFMKKHLAEAEDNHNRDELRDAAVAGTVTQEKAIQRMVANDWAKDEDDAYWKYREWIRKADDKDYKMYDDFLNAIEAGGDVKEAAKEYLEHGKEAKDLSRQITTAYKEQYLAATPEERRKLKQKLLEIYAALGFNRADKSKDIDKWLKEK
jgi:hypothetical protein|nr:MAG TPA_asm: hypothetical protein [Caudoviricetes sp.]